MAYGDRIREIALKRGVPWLAHFTNARNLASILQYGLISREGLEERQIDAIGTDALRLDGDHAAISLSISGINTAMLAAKRQENPKIHWAIVFLEPSVLWTLHCRFCPRNAAHRDVTRMAHRLFGAWAFEAMFEDADPLGRFDGPSYRASKNIPPYSTTREDAEVQVRERIMPELIMGICVDEDRFAEPVERLLKQINVDGGDRNVMVHAF